MLLFFVHKFIFIFDIYLVTFRMRIYLPTKIREILSINPSGNLIKRNTFNSRNRFSFEVYFQFQLSTHFSFCFALIAWFEDWKCLPDFNSTLHHTEMIKTNNNNKNEKWKVQREKKPQCIKIWNSELYILKWEQISQLKKCSLLIMRTFATLCSVWAKRKTPVWNHRI